MVTSSDKAFARKQKRILLIFAKKEIEIIVRIWALMVAAEQAFWRAFCHSGSKVHVAREAPFLSRVTCHWLARDSRVCPPSQQQNCLITRPRSLGRELWELTYSRFHLEHVTVMFLRFRVLGDVSEHFSVLWILSDVRYILHVMIADHKLQKKVSFISL